MEADGYIISSCWSQALERCAAVLWVATSSFRYTDTWPSSQMVSGSARKDYRFDGDHWVEYFKGSHLE